MLNQILLFLMLFNLLEEGIILKKHFPRLATLYLESGITMSELCRRGWGDWTWRRCVCVEVELLVNCATLLHNVVLQNNVSYMWLWRTTHLKTF